MPFASLVVVIGGEETIDAGLLPHQPRRRNPSQHTNHSIFHSFTMADLGSQISQLSPEQRQALMAQAQQEANQSVMQEMMKQMVKSCFDRCAGTSVRTNAMYAKTHTIIRREINSTAVNNLAWPVAKIDIWKLGKWFNPRWKSDRIPCRNPTIR